MELRTDESPLGKFRQGEIVVVEKRSDQAFTGIYATRKIRTQIPLRARPLPAPIRAIAGRCTPAATATRVMPRVL